MDSIVSRGEEQQQKQQQKKMASLEDRDVDLSVTSGAQNAIPVQTVSFSASLKDTLYQNTSVLLNILSKFSRSLPSPNLFLCPVKNNLEDQYWKAVNTGCLPMREGKRQEGLQLEVCKTKEILNIESSGSCTCL